MLHPTQSLLTFFNLLESSHTLPNINSDRTFSMISIGFFYMSKRSHLLLLKDSKKPESLKLCQSSA